MIKSSWNLNSDHGIRYFTGRDDLRQLLKNVRQFLKGYPTLEVVDLNINSDVSLGWTATLIYSGALDEEN